MLKEDIWEGSDKDCDKCIYCMNGHCELWNIITNEDVAMDCEEYEEEE